MQKKYCQKCFTPTCYEDFIPLRCSCCGQPFAGTTASQIKIASPVPKITKELDNSLSARVKRLKQELQEIEGGEVELDETPNTSFQVPELELEDGLQFERPTVKLQSVAFDKGKKEKIVRPKLNKSNIKNVAKIIGDEVSGGGRGSSSSIGGEGGE